MRREYDRHDQHHRLEPRRRLSRTRPLGDAPEVRRSCRAHLALALLVGCSQGGAPQRGETKAAMPQTAAFPITITDDASRTVTLEAAPERIVSLAPANTEILFALGLGDKVVGVTSYDDYPAEVADIAKVGDFAGPNLEAVAAADPDLVVATTGVQADVDRQARGARCDRHRRRSADTRQASTPTSRNLGSATGQPCRGRDARRLHAVRCRRRYRSAWTTPRPVTAFLEVGQNPLFTAGSATLMSELIELGGGKNIVAEPGYVPFSVEQLVKSDPDGVLRDQGRGLGPRRDRAARRLQGPLGGQERPSRHPRGQPGVASRVRGSSRGCGRSPRGCIRKRSSSSATDAPRPTRHLTRPARWRRCALALLVAVVVGVAAGAVAVAPRRRRSRRSAGGSPVGPSGMIDTLDLAGPPAAGRPRGARGSVTGGRRRDLPGAVPQPARGPLHPRRLERRGPRRRHRADADGRSHCAALRGGAARRVRGRSAHDAARHAARIVARPAGHGVASAGRRRRQLHAGGAHLVRLGLRARADGRRRVLDDGRARRGVVALRRDDRPDGAARMRR